MVRSERSSQPTAPPGVVTQSFGARCLGLSFELARGWYVLVVAVCLASLMVFDNLHMRELDRMRSERFSLFLTDLREKVETDLRIGFGIEQDRGAQSRIDELIRQAPDLRSIEIFDLSGKAVASTDRGTVGENIDANWLLTAQAAQGGVWRHVRPDEIVFGVPVRGAYGELAGQITVTYPPRPLGAEARLWADPQIQTLLLLLAVLGLLLPMLLVRGYARSLSDQEQILIAPADIRPGAPEHPLALAQAELAQARQHLQDIQGELDAGQ